MSDPNSPLDYVLAAVRDMTAIGFTSTCRREGEQIVITLTKGANSRIVTLPADFEEADSDALTDALRFPMEKARLELAKLDAKKPQRKKAKAKKRKKAKRKVKPVAAMQPAEELDDQQLEATVAEIGVELTVTQ